MHVCDRIKSKIKSHTSALLCTLISEPVFTIVVDLSHNNIVEYIFAHR